MGVRLVNGQLVSDDDDETTEPVLEPVDDVTPEANPDDRPVCEDCGGIIWEWKPGSRGRRPKFHKEHRPTSPTRSSSPSRGGSFKNETALRDALFSRYAQIAALASMAHPAYGQGIREKIEQAVNADIEYARANPTFRRMLESMVEKTALGAVIAVHGAMLAPIIIGERAKAVRKGAAAQAAAEHRANPNAPRANTPPPPPAPPPMGRVFDFPSEPEGTPETVNAGAMPGMPG